MASISEQQLATWAQSPSQTETDKCDNAVRMIKKAIAASDALSWRKVAVYAQGSYANRTNVRLDSDVDVAVVCSNTFFYDLPPNTTAESFNIQPATYAYADYREHVRMAIVSHFGAGAVTVGNKAFDIKANTYRVEADVAPFFEHHRYTGLGIEPVLGVEMRPANDYNHRIKNWPKQHYDNGVEKNTATGRRYKALVRILKHLANDMTAAGIPAAQPIPSFLCECLIWNVPDAQMGHSTYREDLARALTYLFLQTKTDDLCHEWGEVSELKYLFRPSQPWTRAQAHEFVNAAWDYAGLT